MAKTELAVGDSTKLEIIFSTGRYNKNITKRPKISTNAGPPDSRVEVAAFVVARPDSTYPIVIKPYKLDLTQFGEKVRDEVEFKITNVSQSNLDLSMIACATEYFNVDLPPTLSPGESVKVKLKLKESATDQEFEKSFTFAATEEESYRFTVPVKRKMRPSLQQAGADTKTSDDSNQ